MNLLLLLIALTLARTCLTAADPTNAPMALIQDPGFAQGFTCLGPQSGARRVLGTLGKPERGEGSRWLVAQWNSRFPLSGGQVSPHGLVATNAARWLLVVRESSGPPSLELGVDSRPEYGGVPRTNLAQPWPHLLIEQDFTNAPPLAAIRHLEFELEARLVEAQRFEGPGYSPGLHAAQFQWVVTLQNRNASSKGFGDFLWFVVPMYDDRHATPPPYIAQDFADPSAKLIFNPGAAPFSSASLLSSNWVRFAADLRPHLMEALQTAWAKGYLAGSKDPADYRLTSMNLGWEVPGLNRVSVRVRQLKLEATLNGAHPPP
jgi:hypothetical protein